MSRRFQSKEQQPASLNDLLSLPTNAPVAVYYRQSTYAQVGNISTAIQTIDMVADLIRRGWRQEDVILIDMDEGVSGTKKIEERDGMRRLFQLITDSAIGAVACQDEDRLFRDVTQIQVNIFIEACRAAQVQVITPSVTYVFHHPIQGDFFRRQFRFKCEMAAEYINTVIVGKLNRARDRLMKEGKWGGARIPMGFMIDMREKVDGQPNPNYRRFVVFEPFAKVVREYFRIFIETNGNLVKTYELIFARGLFFPSLEDNPVPNGFKVNYHLAREHVPTRPAIAQMMTNPVYIGHWMFRGAVILWSNHSALISADVFYEAFNLASRYTLEGEENTHYQRVKENPRPSREKRRNVRRPICEGLVWLFRNDEWRKLGTHYDAGRKDYVYVYDQQAYDPRKKIWQRSAAAIDEAVVFHLHKMIRSTFDNERWRETAAQEIAEAESVKRRIQAQIEALERAKEDIIQNLSSLKTPETIVRLEARYVQMEAEQKQFREQLAQYDNAKHLTHIAAFDEFLAAVEHWHLLSRDEQRPIVLTFIQRVEIPRVTPHRELSARIIWFDNTVQEFTVRRSVAKADLWTLEELDTLEMLVKAGATQLEIARALPTRKWVNIRRQIRERCGRVRIPDNHRLHENEAFQGLNEMGGNESNSRPNSPGR